ncbi:MAG: hypothetical protein ABIM99_06005 [Candidatus Dojkabacteria bacterium]
MRNTLFIASIVLLVASASFYFVVYSVKNANNNYWGSEVSSDGLWLNKQNLNIERYKVKESVKGSFAGTEMPENQDKDLIVIRLVDDIDKTDYKVTIPRQYNTDIITLTPTEIIDIFKNKGTGVIDLINASALRAGYINSIFLAPAQ